MASWISQTNWIRQIKFWSQNTKKLHYLPWLGSCQSDSSISQLEFIPCLVNKRWEHAK